MKTNRGRPPKPEGEKAEAVFQIRLNSAEKEVWQEAADRAGIKLSAWIKDRLNKAANREARASQ